MKARIFGLLVAGVLLSACGGDDSPATAKPTNRALLAENAKVLDAAGHDALERFDVDGELVELSFSSASAVLEELAEGDVLIIGSAEAAPNGALVKVEQVSVEDDVVVRGRPAELGEAFEELSFYHHALLDTLASTSFQAKPGLVTSQQALGLTFPVLLRAESDKGSLELDGSLSLDADLDLELKLDLSRFKLEELALSFSAAETFLAELEGQGAASFEESVTLGHIAFTPITLLIPIPTPPGVVPVVLTPGVRLQAGLSGAIQGDVEASVTQRASFTAGVGYKNGRFGGFSDDESEFDFEQPTYEASASIKAWAGARLEVLIYGAVGPYAGVEAFVEAAANAEGPPLCAMGVVDAGLGAKVGVDFIADYSATLFEHRYPLASFDSCSDDPEATRPALTWAKTLGRKGSPGEVAKAILEQSDGSYLIAGDSNLFGKTQAFAASTWVVRLDPLGNVVWERAFGAVPERGVTRGIAEVSDGVLVVGASGVMKLDVGGNLVWARRYSAAEGFELSSIAPQKNGAAMVTGVFGSPGRAFVMKIDAEGEVEWAKSYAGDGIGRVRTSADGGALIVGHVDRGGDDIYLAKLGSDGSVVWQRAVDNLFDAKEGSDEPSWSSAIDRGYDVVERPGGGFIVVGESYGNFPIPEAQPTGFYASWVVELNADGEVENSMIYRVPGDAMYGGAYGVGLRSNGSAIVVARRADRAEDLLSNEDVVVIQDGAFHVLGGGGNDTIYGGTLARTGRGMPLEMTRDGGSIVSLTSDSFSGKDEFFIVKLNRTGGISFDYRRSLSGASYPNAAATSYSLGGSPKELEVSGEAIEVPAETSEVVSATLAY